MSTVHDSLNILYILYIRQVNILGFAVCFLHRATQSDRAGDGFVDRMPSPRFRMSTNDGLAEYPAHKPSWLYARHKCSRGLSKIDVFIIVLSFFAV